MKEYVVAMAGSVVDGADEALLEQLCEAAIDMWKGRLTGATIATYICSYNSEYGEWQDFTENNAKIKFELT